MLAGGADADSVVSAEVRTVAAGADAASVLSAEVRAVLGSADARPVVSVRVRTLATGVVCCGVSVLVGGVSLSAGDDVSVATLSDCRAFVVFRRSRLRIWRHVSELCSEPAVLGPTAGFAPSALLVSASSCPVIGKPLRI